jgi:hypothetical protein
MATFYKPLGAKDITTNKEVLCEAVPITGTIVSGTYINDQNIKNYAHNKEMFQAVFDYPYLSSSANHIFDLAVGFSPESSLSGATIGGVVNTDDKQSRKINMYNQMSQVLVGYSQTGSILRFDQDADLASTTKIDEAFFINFSRLIVKDEIQKQSFSLTLNIGGTSDNPDDNLLIQDHGALTSYYTDSPCGEFGILYTASTPIHGNSGVGLLYYQAGIAVITASVFTGNESNYLATVVDPDGGATLNYNNIRALLISGSISGSCDAFRNRLANVSFNNTTEINSTIYFCRANFNEFNYSSNPTYLSSSQIRVKRSPQDQPRAYITSCGLYTADGELAVVAKLSNPIEKNYSDEVIIRVRVDS